MLRLGSGKPGVTVERRYDEGTLRKVTALAARLQSEKQETLTAREIEAIGAEAGLEPAFIQQALAQVIGGQPAPSLEKAKKGRFWRLVAAFGILLFSSMVLFLILMTPRYESVGREPLPVFTGGSGPAPIMTPRYESVGREPPSPPVWWATLGSLLFLAPLAGGLG
jgi:hypothetical protein